MVSKGWRRLTCITNDKLEEFGLNISICTNCDAAPLKSLHTQWPHILPHRESLFKVVSIATTCIPPQYP